MTLKKKTVLDVENMFDFLLGVVALAKGGDKQELEDGALEYSKMIIQSAEESLRQIGLFEKCLGALDVAEDLIAQEDLKQAYKVIQQVSCEVMQKSGTTDQLRNHLDKLH